MRCFTAVVLEEAAEDNRERSFAPDAEGTVIGWLEALGEAAVHRVIWVGSSPPVAVPAPEYASIDPAGGDPDAIAAEVAALDEVASL